MSSYVGYNIIARVIVERVSNMKCKDESSWQQRDERHHVSIEHLSKRDANAGGWMSDRMLTRMGYNPYAN